MTNPDHLAAALADRYRLERELGQGGMATVYLAEDLRHHRRVAIKVLKPELAAVLGADRFVQEITTTAQLQHPHILPLFDSGSADGFLYYVMPYIEGETLRTKLDREHQLGVDEAVKITREVADALDYAHRHGVIHRDIKPENILLHDGRAMVADFGIALALSAAAGGRMTETGLSLGTPHYMSPEQATAEKEITARSDVYSLASVLYEMLAGQPPHLGGSAQQIIMKIIAEPVAEVTTLRKSVPPNVAAALMKALEKLPADRFESAKAFAEALGDPRFTVRMSVAAQRGHAGGHDRSRLAALAATGVAAAAILIALWGWLRPRASAPRTAWATSIILPDSASLGLGFDLSPDGKVLVYSDAAGGPLRVRRAGSSTVTSIPGTAGGFFPRISPDGRRVAFHTRDAVEAVALDGGAPVRVGGSSWWAPLAWTDEAHVAFTSMNPGVVVRAPVGGGTPEVLSSVAGALVANSVLDALPDHDGFIMQVAGLSVSPDSASIAVVGPTGGPPSVLMPGLWARYAQGWLFVARGDGSIVAFPFDPKRRQVTGQPVPLVSGVRIGYAASAGIVATSGDGHVVYATSGTLVNDRDLVRVTRAGAAIPVDASWVRSFSSVAVSPDGRRIAAVFGTGAETGGEKSQESWEAIGIRDLASGSVTRATVPNSDVYDPAFTPDGGSVIFVQADYTSHALYRVSAAGGAPARIWGEVLAGGPDSVSSGFDGVGLRAPAASPDGRRLYFTELIIDGRRFAVRAVDLDSLNGPSRVVAAHGAAPAPSPDGRWLAYLSDASGSWTVAVRSTDLSSDQEWQVAPDARAGSVVRWSRDGRELFYLAGDSLYAAQVAAAAGSFQVVSRRALFAAGRYGDSFDVMPNGDFIMLRPVTGRERATVLHMIDDLSMALSK
jgi:Tol biopolymer transport system component/tRNA A-37 threonylcarbamoyl transferase component Bud32